MNEKEIIDLFEFLVELKGEKVVPDKMSREYDNHINSLKVLIVQRDFDRTEKNKSLLVNIIAFLIKIFTKT